ncbi:Radical SAM domain protein [Anaeromyxobacter dehalogenans 2CP-1]|uniref:7-carboxy-7-deazaguanine synthase n=1 Tax=Anaeromyxobacter dehalogenans (strain ATCC BAA-258 / DSM 21875 / 2CP-1) TaxID=455488 RepID=B8JDE6_ANAD2|nr:radical SAM protein [Anaeromyxobacter dehalogenans]ACL65995.1 Radical SAM domain protein [Anaeromyxobacter dehalogenans 2CP-1]
MRVTEIFFSIQGEGSRAGRPCVFVRFTGCDLRCGYCDTAYAFHGGADMDRAAILAEVARHPARFVCLTGGEPMLQRELPDLARELLARGYEVAVETHGQRPLDALPAEAIRVVDVKTPGSGEVATDLAYLDRLQPHDEVKFVVCSEDDFRWSREVVRRHALEGRVQVLFSPAWGQVAPRDLVRWMLESGLDARLSLQVHKVVWGPDVHGV